ncbi:MAG: hypothetical protein JJE04_16200 [Acidobacteriia bacterium]|nr:hypothetical protein [Terriglobia bacterium]
MDRRNFLALTAALPVAGATRKRIALVITEYRLNAHADVIAGRLMGGYEYYGKHVEPRTHPVAMYTAQVPKNDMSRDMAAKYGVKIHPTIREALQAGGDKLAVDGVVLIGEHGNYPSNEKGQHMYPRYELFQQIVEVYESNGRAVPTFCDKHLSYDWEKAKWMYDASRRLKFPLLAGSSIPVAWRRPELELELGAKIKHAVCTFSGPKEAYGFHALEGLQCMVERRQGGETGVARVQCLDGAAVWQWTGENPWAAKLMEAAMARSEKRVPGNVRDNVTKPSVFLVRYRDGLEAALYMTNGHAEGFTFAAEVEGRAEPASTLFWLQGERYYSHFCGLTHYIEELILRGKEPYPVERTLLTTGVLAAAMDSSWQKGAILETPHLNVSYRPVKQSLYNRGAVPAPEKKL